MTPAGGSEVPFPVYSILLIPQAVLPWNTIELHGLGFPVTVFIKTARWRTLNWWIILGLGRTSLRTMARLGNNIWRLPILWKETPPPFWGLSTMASLGT